MPAIALAFGLALVGCATDGGKTPDATASSFPPETSGLPSLYEAIRASAEQMGSDLAERKVAVVAFGSNSEALSEYVIDELSRALALMTSSFLVPWT